MFQEEKKNINREIREELRKFLNNFLEPETRKRNTIHVAQRFVVSFFSLVIIITSTRKLQSRSFFASLPSPHSLLSILSLSSGFAALFSPFVLSYFMEILLLLHTQVYKVADNRYRIGVITSITLHVLRIISNDIEYRCLMRNETTSWKWKE